MEGSECGVGKSFYLIVKLMEHYSWRASSALENIMWNMITAAGTMDNINTETKIFQ